MNPDQEKAVTALEKVSAGLAILWPLLAAIAVVAVCGCAYKGAKVVEGTDLAVGVTIPATEGTAELNVLNYLSGFRLGVDRNAQLRVKYTVAETNSYFGCVTIRSAKTIDASVYPCESFTNSVTNR